MSRQAVTAALAGVLAGCTLEDTEQGGEEASAWLEVDVVRFGDDGETATLDIPASEPLVALALRATTDPGVCFQLSTVVDGDGRAPVDGRSVGAYCRGCALRTSVAVESGVFVLPRVEDRLDPELGLSLRFARVDCQTLTPLTRPIDRPTLRLEARPIAMVPAHATIDLRLHVADSSILFGDEARQQALMAALERELAPGGLTPRLVETRELAAAPDRLRFHAGDPGDLAAALAEVPRDEATLEVVFGGCLLHDDPIFGPPAAVDGYTPRIPGGAGPADGVFMAGLDCFAEDAGPVDLPVDAQARVLAHEIGHYLGLYHAVEVDGLADPLADTDSDNLMNPRPTLASAVGFTPSQGRVMRMHLAVRVTSPSPRRP